MLVKNVEVNYTEFKIFNRNYPQLRIDTFWDCLLSCGMDGWNYVRCMVSFLYPVDDFTVYKSYQILIVYSKIFCSGGQACKNYNSYFTAKIWKICYMPFCAVWSFGIYDTLMKINGLDIVICEWCWRPGYQMLIHSWKSTPWCIFVYCKFITKLNVYHFM